MTTNRPRREAWRILLRGIARNRGPVALSFLLLAIWQLSEAMVSVVVGLAIDRAVATGDVVSMVQVGGLLVLIFVSLIVTYRYGVLASVKVDQTESHRTRLEITRHILRARGARSGLLPGEVLSLATSDADAVGGLARSSSYAFASAAAVVVSAVALFQINTVIALMVLIGVPAVVIVTQLMAPMLSRRSSAQQARIAAAGGAASDLIRGLRVIKGIGAERESSARYRARSTEAAAASIRSAFPRGAMEGLAAGHSGAFLAAVALIAGWSALHNDITVGEFVAIVGLTQFLGVPVSAFGWIGAQAAASYASAQRIATFLESPPLVETGTRQESFDAPRLTLGDVRTGNLDGLTLESAQGELLCLVVDDPATTADLLRLLTGEGGGAAQLDGIALDELEMTVRQRPILVNPHHPDLFEGTLRENFDPEGRHDDVGLARVMEAAAVNDIVRLHEEGLGLPVTSNGAMFSGGQRQRIALARALAAEAPILILDHPTTAVDAFTEQQIAQGIRSLRHEPGSRLATWIVTSSPVLLAQADRVALVHQGRMVADGSHHDLLAEPRYRERVER